MHYSLLKIIIWIYKRRPRRPPLRLVLSDGIGVTSSILPIFIPDRARALRADCAPGPGVLVLDTVGKIEFLAYVARERESVASSSVLCTLFVKLR